MNTLRITNICIPNQLELQLLRIQKGEDRQDIDTRLKYCSDVTLFFANGSVFIA
jgi:hypothetical protein